MQQAPHKAPQPMPQQAGPARMGIEERFADMHRANAGMLGQTDMSGHGQKLPCPQGGWCYVDPKKQIQGPFTLHEMQQWNMMGYFRADLPIRCCDTDTFVPFAELFPHPLIPFQSYPKRRAG